MSSGMAISGGLLVVLAVVVGVAWGLATPAILRWLPEPAAELDTAEPDTDDPDTDTDDPDDAAASTRTSADALTALTDRDDAVNAVDAVDAVDDKIPYASLATGPFAVSVGVLAALAIAFAAAATPIEALPLWVVLATVGVLLAAIDARTTWLPLPLTRIGWVGTALAIGVGGLIGGWPLVLRGVVGFVVAGVIFGAIWLATRGGFGFGDVRYAPLVGAATAGVSWTLLGWGLVLGSLVGAVVGLVRLALRRRGAFAYAPSILGGGYLALTLAWLTT